MMRLVLVAAVAAACLLGSSPASAAWHASGSGRSPATNAASAPAGVTGPSLTCTYDAGQNKNKIVIAWTLSVTPWAPTQVVSPENGTAATYTVARSTGGTFTEFVPLSTSPRTYSYTLRAGAGTGTWLHSGVLVQNSRDNRTSNTTGRC